MSEKYQQVISAYENMILKEPNTGENKLLKTMLKRVHEKCIRAEEAYQQAMELYLQTMNKFIEVQQSVMLSYLNGKQSDGPMETKYLTAPVNNTNILKPHDVESVSASVSMVTPDVPQYQSELSSNSEATIETVKEVCTKLPGDEISSATLATSFLKLVSERTGYPVEMLDLNANMEADLGIDSIKRIEILGSFNEEHASYEDEIDVENISELRTLQQMINYMTEYYLNHDRTENKIAIPKKVPVPAGEVENHPFAGRIISFEAGVSATIESLTIEDGYVSGADDDGAAIYLVSGTTLKLNDAIFEDNRGEEAGAFGGAIYCPDTTVNITVDGCTFNRNKAHGGPVAYRGTWNVSNSEFNDNPLSFLYFQIYELKFLNVSVNHATVLPFLFIFGKISL